MKMINYDQYLKLPRDAWPPQKGVNMHCKFNQLKVIENVLRRENAYDEFQGCCFKNFLKVPEHHTFSAQLVHNLLLREISLAGANPDEIWFSIGGSKARFSKREFCLVTGLKFGKLSDIFLKEYKPLKDGIHMRYFHGDMDLRLTRVLERFQQGRFTRPQDCLKMALVLIANNVLFGQDYRRKVTFWLLSLVENLKDFNDFAWGHYVFKLTNYYLRLGLGRSNLYGFPWALQIWAIEAIMSMRTIFADRLPNSRPRFLKWSLKRKPKKFEDQLKSLEEKGEFNAKDELRPTRSEVSESYWDGIDTDLSQGPQFVPPSGLGDDEEVFVDLVNVGGGEQREGGDVGSTHVGDGGGGEPIQKDHVQTVGQVGNSNLLTTYKRKSIPRTKSRAERKKCSRIFSPLMDDSPSRSPPTYSFPHAAPLLPSPCPQGLDDIAMLRQAIDAFPSRIEDFVKRKMGALEDRILTRFEVIFPKCQPTSPQQLQQAIGAIPQQIEDVVKREMGALEDRIIARMDVVKREMGDLEDRIMARIEALFANCQATSPQEDSVQDFDRDNIPNPFVVEGENNATFSEVVAAKFMPAYEVQMLEAAATAEVAPEVEVVKYGEAKEFVQSEEVMVSAEDMHGEEVATKDLLVAASEVPRIEVEEGKVQMEVAMEGLIQLQVLQQRRS